jgi:hypothetical protein
VDPNASPPPPSDSSAKIDSLVGVVENLVGVVKERQEAGDTEAAARAAQMSGLSEEMINKLVSEAQAEGDVGKGIAKAIKAAEASSQMSTLTLVGQQKIDMLSVHPKYSAAFEKHGTAFRKYLSKSGLNLAGLAAANPATGKPYSEEIFDYFLLSQTPWYKDQSAEREQKAREEERKKMEEEIRARGGSPAAPSLPSGAAPEGGSLRDSIRRATGEAAELTEAQVDRAKRLGLSEDDLKEITAARAQKTTLGTPLPFIPTSNKEQ